MVFLKAMLDETFIRKTLSLAARARGMTSPNPMVGALIVKRGKIISEGYHKRAGTPHAEVIAIDKAGLKARGATLYVSLEPCCHTDKRTPPCTGKIIASGIKKVVIAMKDPNKKVSGKGIKELRNAGIEVVSGVLEREAQNLNEFYIKHISSERPFVILKVAMTLDGKIATPEGRSKWITGEAARREVHKLRRDVDAIMTAIGTVKADNPSLTCRITRNSNPVRIIIDPRLETPLQSQVLCIPPDTVIVTAKDAAKRPNNLYDQKRASLLAEGIRILESPGERVDLRWLMKKLGEMGITSVLCEGGSSFNSSCLESGIVDKVMFFIASKIIGGEKSYPAIGGKAFRDLEDAYRIGDITLRRIGDDILVEGYLLH